MGLEQLVALIAPILLVTVIRAANIVIEWLARVLNVPPPEPIDTADVTIPKDRRP